MTVFFRPFSVVQQHFTTEVNNEHVIQGNSAVLKCVIPSFVADYVSVVSWQDETGETYSIHESLGTYQILSRSIQRACHFAFPLCNSLSLPIPCSPISCPLKSLLHFKRSSCSGILWILDSWNAKTALFCIACILESFSSARMTHCLSTYRGAYVNFEF